MFPNLNDIIEYRPPKKPVDPGLPYHFLHEKEVDSFGTQQPVNTIFLTNNECPFKCVMCDLWKHTLDEPTPEKAIPHQIEYALEQLPPATVVKLYNNGNFFDTKAIPSSDYSGIAQLLSGYDRVIVENHPKLCGPSCIRFQGLLKGKLEIAMGLETIHPKVLPKLNKQVTKDNFIQAAAFLGKHDIDVRAFILLNPPFLTDRHENIEWARRSAEFAFEHGATACSIIPTRPGNGILDHLQKTGQYVPPALDALEEAFEKALALGKGRVFVDLWDLEQFSSCDHCFDKRRKRLATMNREQRILPPVSCKNCHDR